MMCKTDAELLHEWSKGQDEEAIRLLIARHGALVQSTARRRLHDPEMAPDIAGQVFLLLANRPGRVPASHLAGWLVKVTQHLCTSENRSAARRHVREQKAFSQQLDSAPTMSPQTQDLSQRIDATLHKLKPDERECLLLHYAEGLSHQEVADRIGSTEDATRMRISRAMERLRQKLGISASALIPGLEEMRVLPLETSEIEQLTSKTLLASKAGATVGTATLGLRWILMTTKQKIGTSLVVSLLLIGTGTGAALQSGSPAAGSPKSATSAAWNPSAFVGKYTGKLTYVVRRTGRKVSLAARTEISLIPGGMRYRVNYEDPNWGVNSEVKLSPDGKELRILEKGQLETYAVESLEPNKIVGTDAVDEPGRPRIDRLTVSRTGTTLSVLIEEKLPGKPWQFANEHLMELVK